MIAALVFSGQVLTSPMFLEFPQESDPNVAIEAVVKVRDLEPEQRYMLKEAARYAVQYTAKYGKRDMENLLSPGYSFRVNLNGDFLRIGFTVDRDRMNSGMSMMHSILTEPSFIADSIKRQPLRDRGVWNTVYEVSPAKECSYESYQLDMVWRAVVHRDSVQIGVRGDFAIGEAKKMWNNQYTQNWLAPSEKRLPLPRAERPGLPPETDVRLLILESPQSELTETEFAASLLSATVMGTGKECLLWKVCRESLQMSYRQESFLVSDRKGWRFRIAVATDDQGVSHDAIAKLKDELAKAIEGLTKQDIEWAIGAAQGYLKNQLPTLPMVVGVGGFLDHNPADTLYLNLLWHSKTGSTWNPEQLLSLLQKVELDQVKKRLVDVLNRSNVRIVGK